MPADMVAVRQKIYSEPGIDRIMPRMLTLFDPVVRARNNLSEAEWRSIRAPALIVAHVDSPDIYLETANRIINLIPNAQLLEMRNTAHWSHYEAANAFNDIAIQFLETGDVKALRQRQA
jgi:2-hydroxy-6-oxonona-2,4-dienedioate hydrolase